jgi:hypothetical protein
LEDQGENGRMMLKLLLKRGRTKEFYEKISLKQVTLMTETEREEEH